MASKTRIYFTIDINNKCFIDVNTGKKLNDVDLPQFEYNTETILCIQAATVNSATSVVTNAAFQSTDAFKCVGKYSLEPADAALWYSDEATEVNIAGDWLLDGTANPLLGQLSFRITTNTQEFSDLNFTDLKMPSHVWMAIFVRPSGSLFDQSILNSKFIAVCKIDTDAGAPVSGDPEYYKASEIDSAFVNRNDFSLVAEVPLTLSSGAVTKSASVHTLAVETGTADDLITFSGLSSTPSVFFIRLANPAHTITFKNGTGNIYTDGGTDFTFTGSSYVQCYSNGTNVYMVKAGISQAALDLKQNLVSTVTAGHLAALDANGQSYDAGISIASVAGSMIFQRAFGTTSGDVPATGVSKGWYYICEVNDYVSTNASNTFNIKDWAVYNGTTWDKIDAAESGKVLASVTDTTPGYLDGKVAKSIVVASDKLELSGDESTPSDNKFYGKISGSKGWHTVDKTFLGLNNVSNDAQLKIASNLSDLNSTVTSRINLGTPSYPNGIEDPTKLTFNYNKTTRVLTLTFVSGFAYWLNGVRYAPTGTYAFTAHADATASYFYFWNTLNAPTVQTTAWSIFTDVQIAYVYYNAVTGNAMLYNERHPSNLVSSHGMDETMHHYLHNLFGAQIAAGGFLVSDYTVGTQGDAALSYSVSQGYHVDEDIGSLIPAVADGGPYRIQYRLNANANNEWNWSDTSVNGIMHNGTDIYYNQNNAGTWQLTPITNNSRWVNYYLCVKPSRKLDDSGWDFPICSIMGQALYTSLASAQAEDSSTAITWGDVYPQEFVLFARITYQRVSGSSPGNAQIASVAYIRTNRTTTVSGFSTTAHNNLTGRTDADCHPAAAITNTPAGNIAAVTVQAAINELDTEKVIAPASTTENKVPQWDSASKTLKDGLTLAGVNDVVQATSTSKITTPASLKPLWDEMGFPHIIMNGDFSYWTNGTTTYPDFWTYGTTAASMLIAKQSNGYCRVTKNLTPEVYFRYKRNTEADWANSLRGKTITFVAKILATSVAGSTVKLSFWVNTGSGNVRYSSTFLDYTNKTTIQTLAISLDIPLTAIALYFDITNDSTNTTDYFDIVNANIIDTPLNNSATAAPAVTDDYTKGYSIRSIWVNTDTDKSYICSDNASGAAVWTEITAGAASGEANTASNVGSTGVGVYKEKNGVDLRFYKVLGSAGVSFAANGTDYIDVKADIHSVTELAEAPATGDELLIYDTSASANKRITFANLTSSISAGVDLGQIMALIA